MEKTTVDDTLASLLELYATMVQVHFTAKHLDKSQIKFQALPILQAMGLATQSDNPEEEPSWKSKRKLRRLLEAISAR
jgi:hypothetical protein